MKLKKNLKKLFQNFWRAVHGSWILFLAYSPFAYGAHSFKVVLDPGHGGPDEGTVYQGTRGRITEKEATLALAREVARELRTRKINVVLTRNEDKPVPLGARTALANRIGADLFLSIHMNSTPPDALRPDAEGMETYILNNTSDETSKRLARLENTVLGDEPAGAEAKNSRDVALILRDLTLDANLAESKRLACLVQGSLISQTQRSNVNVKNRGVKQALFHVLLGAEMPSILLEAGFLNHGKDRRLIASPEGRHVLGASIASAIDRFRKTKGTREALLSLNRCRIH